MTMFFCGSKLTCLDCSSLTADINSLERSRQVMSGSDCDTATGGGGEV